MPTLPRWRGCPTCGRMAAAMVQQTARLQRRMHCWMGWSLTCQMAAAARMLKRRRWRRQWAGPRRCSCWCSRPGTARTPTRWGSKGGCWSVVTAGKLCTQEL